MSSTEVGASSVGDVVFLWVHVNARVPALVGQRPIYNACVTAWMKDVGRCLSASRLQALGTRDTLDPATRPQALAILRCMSYKR